ncbi:hypothetical protein G7Y89_g12282 [Cudoniella acicularis]|uniref:PLC-like phosphodiesterase n=1 Tax=Cudoniella acicularis TaxID=354080 RepID=A0A8H4R9C7_9HELO|nr:hypothetical protein G7Y89_g12282 [Cudoniella acicularis]
MLFKLSVFKLVAFLAACGQIAWAGPGGYVSLINGTPYNWTLVYSHSYQMDWKPADIIPAGSSHQQYFEYWYHHGNSGDCAAEATYVLENSPTPARFTLQARQNGGGKRIEIQYHDTLSSLNNPKNSFLKLGYIHDGSVSFMLSGDDPKSYLSTNPPTAWMQASLPTIGSKTMRDIAIPASHDAGASELTWSWFGVSHNTQTQSVHVYTQLLDGARFFDIRPVSYKGFWYTGHFSGSPNSSHVGGTGRTIEHIISDINRFTSEHPGELIILDLSHDSNIDKWWAPLTPEEWQVLYAELAQINDLWIPSSDKLPKDLSTVPLSTFITPGSKSAVVVIIPNGAPLPGKASPSTRKRDEGLQPEIQTTFPPEGVKLIVSNVDPGEIPPVDTENGFGDYPEAEFAKWTVNLSDELSHESLPNNKTTTTSFPSAIFKTIAISKTTAPKIPLTGPWTGAFIPSHRLPHTGSSSSTRWPSKLTPDQLSKLAVKTEVPHRSTWTLTQYWTDVTDVATRQHSIIYMARYAKKELLGEVWGKIKEGGEVAAVGGGG